MPPLQAIGLGVLLPAVVAAVILLPLRLRPGLGDRVARLLGGLAIALGFFAGYVGLGFAPLKPDDAWNWLPWLGVGAALITLLDRPGWVALLVRLAAAVLAAWLLMPAWEPATLRRTDVGLLLGFVVFLLWATDRQRPDHPSRLAAVTLTLTAAAGTAVIFLGGSAKLAQLGGALTAALAAAAVAMPLRGSPPPGIMPVVAVLLPGLQASGLFDTHSEVPRLSYVLPVFALLGLDQLAQASGAMRLRFALLIVLILAAAVGFAYWAEPIDWREVFAPAEPPA